MEDPQTVEPAATPEAAVPARPRGRPVAPINPDDVMTSKAQEAWVLYRDMGVDRSVVKVATILGKTADPIYEWSAKYGWVAKAAEHDARVARASATMAVKRAAARISKAKEDRLIVAGHKRLLGLQALDRLAAINEIPAGTAAQLCRDADETERKDLGEPDSRVEVTLNPNDLTSLSDDELDRLIARLSLTTGTEE